MSRQVTHGKEGAEVPVLPPGVRANFWSKHVIDHVRNRSPTNLPDLDIVANKIVVQGQRSLQQGSPKLAKIEKKEKSEGIPPHCTQITDLGKLLANAVPALVPEGHRVHQVSSPVKRHLQKVSVVVGGGYGGCVDELGSHPTKTKL